MRTLLVLFASASGYLITLQILGSKNLAYFGLTSGLVIAVSAILFEERVKRTPLPIVAGGAIGLIIGLVVANLLTYPLILNFFGKNALLELTVYLLANCIIGYIGLNIGMKKGDEFEALGLKAFGGAAEEPKAPSPIVVDTSVIIDGRIAEVAETGFIEGNLIVTQFVLQELQFIADSPDSIKRTRGKRGLDILKQLQNSNKVNVVISDKDFPNIKEVDGKIVALARDLDGKVLTNDANLNKIAELQGVPVMNMNKLATAMKPVVMPGEALNIMVVKEGKEYGQGVGYLDDGTMVVIDNGKDYLGKAVDVSITSVLQTTGGRMIFSKVKDDFKKAAYQ